MEYKVVITSPAKRQLEKYVAYTANCLKNKQAAKSIIDDAKATKKELAIVAGNLPLCEDEVLAQNSYRKIHFIKHKFFMIYRLDGNIAVVDAMYHELQDYESTFAVIRHLK